MLTFISVIENVEKFIASLSGSVRDETFVKLTLGNYKGTDDHLQKIIVRPIETNKGRLLSFIYRYATRDITKNYDASEAEKVLAKMIDGEFFSGHLFTTTADHQLSIGKKGKSRLSSSKPTFKQQAETIHNRTKNSLIDPARYYLKALGITTSDGNIRDKQQNKWRQINKFVETLGSLIDNSPLKDGKNIRIVDMGSGKGYLTFAAHDYLTTVRGISSEITGVEMRSELVDLCNGIAERSEFCGLKFVQGTIADFDPGETDILIALHACDTATDDAIYKGITSNAAIIMTAPCCHKELRPQIKPPEMFSGILRHGTMLERTAETITDGLRALLMETRGYSTRIFEFISPEHTPKNNMIVGTRTGKANDRALDEIRSIEQFYGIEKQHLQTLLNVQSSLRDGNNFTPRTVA